MAQGTFFFFLSQASLVEQKMWRQHSGGHWLDSDWQHGMNFESNSFKSNHTYQLKKCLFTFQKVEKTAAVGRLTDTARYTGSHKERFDEGGKGRGREGREELVENTGYVGAYKNAGSYDDKMKVNKWVQLYLFLLVCRL